MFDYLKIELYTKAHKIAKIVIIPATLVILLTISVLFFYESDKPNFQSILLSWLINSSGFLVLYSWINPLIFKHKSLTALVFSLTTYVVLTPIIYHFAFHYKIFVFPSAVAQINPPITLLISIFIIVALGVYLTAICLYLILNHFLLSKESYQLLTSGYQTEINALRLQMNPHFISNALNNLSSSIRNKEKEKALAYNTEIRDLIGEQLKYANSETITIQEELSWLEYYLQVEQQRLAYTFNYAIEVNDVAIYNLKIPPMILQPLAENSIIHGFNPSQFFGKGLLTIGVKTINSNLIVVFVRDNGVGVNVISNNNDKIRKSIALENIEKRIQLLNELGEFYIVMQKKAETTGTTIEIFIQNI
jgi:sensor histidine kinase YesM